MSSSPLTKCPPSSTKCPPSSWSTPVTTSSTSSASEQRLTTEPIFELFCRTFELFSTSPSPTSSTLSSASLSFASTFSSSEERLRTDFLDDVLCRTFLFLSDFFGRAGAGFRTNLHWVELDHWPWTWTGCSSGLKCYKTFFSLTLTTRPNKLEGLSLETLSSQVLEFGGKARADPIRGRFLLG